MAHRLGRMLNDNVSTSPPLATDGPLTENHKVSHHICNPATLKPFAMTCTDTNASGAEGLQLLALGTAAVRLLAFIGVADPEVWCEEEAVTAQGGGVTGFAAVGRRARAEAVFVGRSEAGIVHVGAGNREDDCWD